MTSASSSSPPARSAGFEKTVSDLTNANAKLASFLLKDDSIKNLAQIALKYYCGEGLSSLDLEPTVVTKFRSKLFIREPLAVLLALIEAGELGDSTFMDGNESIRDAIKLALQDAVKEGVSIVSPEFHELIHRVDYFNPQVNVAKVHDLLRAMQRLQYLVTDPKDVGLLIQAKMTSANDIAVFTKKKFVEDIVPGMDVTTARKIHDHATVVDYRNQETWVNILSKDFIPGIKPTPGNQLSHSTPHEPQMPEGPKPKASNQTYNLTNIFDLQVSPCEECSSVTSASAYFVDLLEFLKSSRRQD